MIPYCNTWYKLDCAQKMAEECRTKYAKVTVRKMVDPADGLVYGKVWVNE